nr:MAG TPA: hypothetical protein [Caudoviricetes sp.]
MINQKNKKMSRTSCHLYDSQITVSGNKSTAIIPDSGGKRKR